MSQILIIDDNVERANQLARNITLAGHRATAVHDGPRGLEYVTSHECDLIFLDYHLPGMNGYDVAREIKTNPLYSHHSEIPIIGIGDFAAAHPDEATKNLLTAYMEKPIRLAQVLAMIAKYCT